MNINIVKCKICYRLLNHDISQYQQHYSHNTISTTPNCIENVRMHVKSCHINVINSTVCVNVSIIHAVAVSSILPPTLHLESSRVETQQNRSGTGSSLSQSLAHFLDLSHFLKLMTIVGRKRTTI